MFEKDIDVSFWEWIATKTYANQYISTYGFVNNIEVPQHIYDIDWTSMEESLEEGISDKAQISENDVIDDFIEVEVEGDDGFNSKTKMNRVGMIRALIDWSQIENENYDINHFFEAREKSDEQDNAHEKHEL